MTEKETRIEKLRDKLTDCLDSPTKKNFIDKMFLCGNMLMKTQNSSIIKKNIRIRQ